MQLYEYTPYNVLKGVDFERTQIDAITVETNGEETRDLVIQYLIDNGFQSVYEGDADTLFIHRDAKEKMVWFKQWESKRALYLAQIEEESQ